MATLYAGELLIKLDGKPLAFVQSCSLDMSTAFQDTTNKDSGDFEESTPGLKSWGANGDGLVSIWADSSKSDVSKLMDAWLNQTLISIVFNSKDGAITYTGNAYIEKLSMSSKTKDTPTFSFSVKGSGVPTFVTGSSYKVDSLLASVLSETSLSLTYNATGAYTKVGLEASADGSTGWAKVGTDITAAPYKSYQILTVTAGVKSYRAWVCDASNVKVYSNIISVTS
jgi:hypothetical protein